MTIQFKGGRLAPDPTRLRIHLGPRLDLAAVVVPTSRDWCTKAGPYAMLVNDRLGICVLAEVGHHEQSTAAFGEKQSLRLTDAQIIAAYSAITGYDPTQEQPDGSNPTDLGTNMQDAQNYWRKAGVGGHKTLAFAAVDIHNMDEVCAAIELFGAIAVGVNFSRSAMDQFNAGHGWTVAHPDGGIEGGHAIHVAGFDKTAQTFTLTTWGKVITMTWDWWRAYVEEAWVAVLPEWFDTAGHSPQGLDLHGLGEDFAAITGQPNPFPAPSPSPTPAPPPFPGPVGLAVAALVNDPDTRVWLARHHLGLTGQIQAHVTAIVAAAKP